MLDEFATAIHQFTQGKVKINREPGFLVNVGQEYRVLLQSASGGPAQPMFRIYIKEQGYPVSLDLHEEGLLPCLDKSELEAALSDFLKDPNVLAQIDYFRNR